MKKTLVSFIFLMLAVEFIHAQQSTITKQEQEIIDLVAVVGNRDAINPFMVTEVFVKENGKWKLGQLTFSHLSRPLKLNASQQ